MAIGKPGGIMTTDTFQSEPDTLGRPRRVRLPLSDIDVPVAALGLPHHLRVLNKISQGGMGAIYRAYDSEASEVRAIKILLPQYSHDVNYLLRFTREARTAHFLEHKSLVSIYADGLSETGLPYIVMDFVDGCNLSELIAKRSLTIDEAVILFMQAADALAYAHRKSIVHRDLKPSNIMVTTDEMDNFLVKVVDFGIAKMTIDQNTLNTELTGAGEVLGTPAYMSPEQARARVLDQRSDIYSLGAVMYYALTGAPPFQAASVVEILEAQLKSVPTNLHELRNEIPLGLAQIIDKTLEKLPAERYQTMDELVGDLKRFSEGQRTSITITGRQRRVARQVIGLLRVAFIAFCVSWLVSALVNLAMIQLHLMH